MKLVGELLTGCLPGHPERDGDLVPRPATGTRDLHDLAQSRLINANAIGDDRDLIADTSPLRQQRPTSLENASNTRVASQYET